MAKAKEESFEQILKKLDEVVDSLEKGDLSLEDSLERFELGVKLSRAGTKRLAEAERRIEEILEDGSITSALTPEKDE